MDISILVGIIVATLIILWMRRKERFATKTEKVDTVYNWWSSTKSPTYSRYKNDVRGSDAVEYKKVKDIVIGGAELTKEHVENIVT